MPPDLATARFDVTLEDVTAFALQHHDRSPTLRARRRVLHLGLTLTFALVAATVAGLLRSAGLGAIGLSIAVVFYLLFPTRYRRGLRDGVRRMYAEGRNAAVLGPHEVKVTPEFLVEQTPLRETRIAWAAVEGLIRTDEYLFVYVSGSTAVIVPHRAFPDTGDARRFEHAVRSRLPPEAAG